MPRSAPTITISASGRSARSACASASAGIRWPPVPPPVNKTFTPNVQCRISNIEYRSSSPSDFDIRLSIFDIFLASSGLPPGSPLPNADKYPRRSQRNEQARTAVRHERQRDARRGKNRQRHPHVQHRADTDDRREPGREQLAERVARRARDAEAEPHEHAERHREHEQ